MTPRTRPERLLELAADRALVGLGAGEAFELERLLAEHGESEALELELAAAELDLALAASALEPLPAALQTSLARCAQTWWRAMATPSPARPARPVATRPAAAAPRGSLLPLAGWVFAAAALVLAVLGWLPQRPPGEPRPVDPAQAYSALCAQPDTVNPRWEATELARGVSGEVAWSQERQCGYLHIVGLAANDPAVEQYQLWILDGEQRQPIDGGVFDLHGGEEWIPIDPKLAVAHPTAFAVTIEKRGGVVVSAQERVVLVAKL